MFGDIGDIGEPQLVRLLCREPAGDEIVMDRWTRFSVQSSFLREHRPDPLLRTQPGDTIFAGDDASPR